MDSDISTARMRLLLTAVLFAWLFAHITLTLVLVTLSIRVPYLSLMIHAIFVAIFTLFSFRNILISLYGRLLDRIVISQLRRTLSERQLRDNASAIQMLRSLLCRNLLPKILVILTIVVYISATQVFLGRTDSSSLFVLTLIIAIFTADELLLAYRIGKNRYADNEGETRELLAWITQTATRNNKGGPPERLLPRPERITDSNEPHRGRVPEI